MNIVELIESYGPQVIENVILLGLLFVVGKFRAVADNNLVNVFNQVKEQAKSVELKNYDIGKSIEQVSAITTMLDNAIKRIENNLSEEIKHMNHSILAFQEGDLYTLLNL